MYTPRSRMLTRVRVSLTRRTNMSYTRVGILAVYSAIPRLNMWDDVRSRQLG